jgi:hypothetical protein
MDLAEAAVKTLAYLINTVNFKARLEDELTTGTYGGVSLSAFPIDIFCEILLYSKRLP